MNVLCMKKTKILNDSLKFKKKTKNYKIWVNNQCNKLLLIIKKWNK
jgi:hypothetical protein